VRDLRSVGFEELEGHLLREHHIADGNRLQAKSKEANAAPVVVEFLYVICRSRLMR